MSNIIGQFTGNPKGTPTRKLESLTASVAVTASYAATASYVEEAGEKDPIWIRGTGSGSAILSGSLATASGVFAVAEGYGTNALGNNSHAEGSNTLSGQKGYKYINTGNVTNQLTLTSVDGLSVGDVVSIVNDSKYPDCATVTEINGNTVTFDSLPFDSIVPDLTGFDDYLVYVSAKPNVGDVDIAIASHAEGVGTKAQNYTAHAEGRDTQALGSYSHAEGRETTAQYAAHAEGRNTQASGEYSHSEGFNTIASGNKSHAEGNGTISDSYASHTEGYGTVVSNSDTPATVNNNVSGAAYSHAEGNGVSVTNHSSHGEGRGVKVTGNSAHGEGLKTTAAGNASHAEGNLSTASGSSSHAEGYSTIAQNFAEHAEGRYNKSNAGTRHSVGIGTSDNDRKNAFEIMQNGEAYLIGAGGYDGTNPAAATDLVTLLTGNLIWIRGNGADSAVLSGSDSRAEGQHSVAEGERTVASGKYSHAEGYDTKASGPNAHAEGYSTKASGVYSHAEGYGTIASKEWSHAEGNYTRALGYGSHAEGYYTEASGKHSHAEGSYTKASGSYSHTEGESTEALGKHSHAEGYHTTASSEYSHAEGVSTKASGGSSHAEGIYTEATSLYSHAEGYGTEASGYASHAEGYNTTALNGFEHAQGTYNATASGQIFSIGAGHDSNYRKNAISIITGSGTVSSASIYVYGVGTYDGTNPTPGVNDLATIISGSGGSALEKITWSDLKNKRDNSQLTPGQYYEITDYTCTTVQENTQAAGHDFDVVVLALATNKFSEEALATQHEGDSYFAASKLEAWKLWYCLDNDTIRFAWADSENGKGVIYRMIDEWGNDCPYDFKNIQFKRKISLTNGYPELDLDQGVDTWVFTFAATSYHISKDSWSELKDGSLESPYEHMSDENSSTFHDNVIGKYIKNYDNVDEDYTKCGIQYLNDNVFFGYWQEVGSDDPENTPYYYAYCSYGCRFGINCYGNTFGTDCNSNTFGNYCYSNTFRNNCSYNTFGNDCNSNTFGNYCFYNTFGNDCYHNTFGFNCSSNTFGNDCYNNTFGDNCGGNTFGDGCNHISINSNYTMYTVVETGNKYIRLTSSVAPSSANPLRNITIAQGVNNFEVVQIITHPTVGDTYRTVYQPSGSRVVDINNGSE